MQLIKQLLETVQSGPVELVDLISSFPTKYSDALGKVWDTRLQYQGVKWDKLYSGATDSIQKYIEQTPDLFQKEFSIEDSDGDYTEFTADLLIDSSTEVYCGIDLAQPDTLYFGFDVWFSDEDVWETFYKAFKKQFRTAYDEDIDEHREISDRLWKDQLSKQNFGALVKAKFVNGKIKSMDVVTDDANDKASTFYQSIYRSSEFKRLGLKDIRLD